MEAAMDPAFSSSWAVPPGSWPRSQQLAATQGQQGMLVRFERRSGVGHVHEHDKLDHGTGVRSLHQQQVQGLGQGTGGQHFGRLSVPCMSEPPLDGSKGGVGGGRPSTDMSWEETLVMLQDRVTPRRPGRQQQRQQQTQGLGGGAVEGAGDGGSGGGVGAVSHTAAGSAGLSLVQSFRRVIRNISRGTRWGLCCGGVFCPAR